MVVHGLLFNREQVMVCATVDGYICRSHMYCIITPGIHRVQTKGIK